MAKDDWMIRITYADRRRKGRQFRTDFETISDARKPAGRKS